MPSYNTRITKEGGGGEGASKMRFASGASFAGASGALLDWSAGRVSLGAVDTLSVGAAQTAACIASSRLKLGFDLGTSETLGMTEVADLGNGIKFFLGRTQNAPSAAGSPGSLIWRLPCVGTPSSAVDLYIKRGDNNPASGNWVAFQTTASAG